MSKPKKRTESLIRAPSTRDLRTLVKTGKLTSKRSLRRTNSEIQKMRNDLAEHYGGEKIEAPVKAMLDSGVDALGVAKVLWLYVRKGSIFREDALRRGDLELVSMLSKNWVSFLNVARLNLLAADYLARKKTTESPEWQKAIDTVAGKREDK